MEILKEFLAFLFVLNKLSRKSVNFSDDGYGCIVFILRKDAQLFEFLAFV